MTLTEFLLARLDEDEAAARAVPAGPWRVVDLDDGRPYSSLVVEGPPPPEGTIREDQGDPDDSVWVVGPIEEPRIAEHVATFDPARVLAEVEGKRRIVELTLHGCGDDYERVQRAIALPYADHPDYAEAWRP